MSTIQLFMAGAVAILLGSSAVIWLGLLARYRCNTELLGTEPRSLVPWRGTHVAVAFFLYVVLPVMSVVIVQQRFDIPWDEDGFDNNPNAVAWLLGGDSLLKFVAAALTIIFLRIDLKATLSDLGFRANRIKSDLVCGLIAFAAIAPMVYLIQFALKTVYNKLMDEQAAHPIETVIRNNPTASIIFWCFFSVVIAAPFVEEFLFRVVLQGWLEKVFYRTRILLTTQLSQQQPRPGTVIAAEVPPPFMWQPIIISSLTFSLLHVGHGPDPIPLFLLALVLGYLYAKTHRILPCIVVHMALNGFSMLSILEGMSEGAGL